MDVGRRARGIWSGTRGRPAARGVLVLLVLAGLAALVWLCVWLVHQPGGGGPGGAGGRGGFGGRGGRPSTTVGVATATTSDIPITIDGLGTVTPAATVTVSPQVSGVITEILFREGQTVKRGQALAVIDPRPLRNALTQAEGQLARDEAQLANARLLLQRDRVLLAQDSIARQDVDTQAATVRQLEGVVTTDRGAVAQARLNLGFSRVTAPVSGRVGLRVVDVGNYINAGSSTGLVVITQVNPIDVEFTVPQDDVPRIQVQAERGRLPVTAFDRTRTVQLDQGVFSTLDNQIDTTTGTVRAKARFANTAGRLFPNQFVNIRLNLEMLRGVVVVPVTAVRTAADGDFVWKLNPDRTVTRRKVTRGPATAEITSITAGLSPGERVITEGGDRLTEGAHVTLPGDRGGSMMQACAADMKKLCGGKQGREAFMCLRQNQAQLSAGCKGALSSGRRGGGQGRAGGGAGDGGPSAAPAGAPGGEAAAGSAGRGFAPSPEMMAARQAMRQACAGDMQTLCPGQEGREAVMCLRQNAAKADAACQAALAKMPHRGGGGAPAATARTPPPTTTTTTTTTRTRAPAAPAAAAPDGAAGGSRGEGRGGFTPSPEMMAARQAMRQACAADMQKLCAGQQGRELFMCVRQNEGQLSAPCKAALAKMPRRPQPARG